MSSSKFHYDRTPSGETAQRTGGALYLLTNLQIMIGFLLRVAINAVGLLLIGAMSDGAIQFKGFGNAVLAALVLGIANAVVKPILQGIAQSATCVLSCLTLGLWSLLLSWLINGFLFYAVGNYLGLFEVHGFWPPMMGALALSVINSLATALTKDKNDER
jgi:putative membrane protein